MTKKEILESLGYDPNNPQDVEKFYAQYPTEESFQMAMGGMVDEYKKGGWIQKATASIKRRGTEGVCTGSKFGGPTCRPGTKRYALAKTFRKMAKARKKEDGGEVEMYEDGGETTAQQAARYNAYNNPYTVVAMPDPQGLAGDSIRFFPGQRAFGQMPYMRDLGNLIGVTPESYRYMLQPNSRVYQDSTYMYANPKFLPKRKEYGGTVDMYAEGGDVDLNKPYLNPATVQAVLAKANQPVTNTLGRVISTPQSNVPLNFMGQPFATGAIKYVPIESLLLPGTPIVKGLGKVGNVVLDAVNPLAGMGVSNFASSGLKSAAKNTEVPKQYMTEALGSAAKAPKLSRADFVVGSRDKQAAEIADFIDISSPGITLDDLTYDSELKDQISYLIRNNKKGVTTDDVLNKLILNKQYPKTSRALVDPMYVSPTPSIGNKAVIYSNPEFYKSSGTMGGRVPTGDYGLPNDMIRILQQRLDYHAKKPLVYPMSKEEIKRTEDAIKTLYKQSIQYSPKDYQPFRSSDAVKMGLSPNKDGGYVNKYAEGGMVDSYGSGGYTVRRSSDRKGKTHVVIGPDGTKKYFGDPKLGERGKSKYGKEAFYKRHAKNLKNNPYFRAYARATWEDGGMVNSYEDGGENSTWKEGPVSQRDSVANMARNTMIWEANRGSGAGTGLSNFGNPALFPGASIDESVNWYMQNIYPKLGAYPTAMEKASAGDFLYNTGKNLLNYTDWDNRKNDAAALASWEEKLKTLTPNERRIVLNNARDRYYKNTAPAGSTWDLKTQGPHPAYWNTWYGRQHATDQYTPLTDQDVTNRANKKFYPVQKADGGVVDVYQLMGMPTPDMYEMGGDVMMEEYGRGGLIKRKDGSYSRRGLWDNIRANRGSGRKPTKEMLKQERKIRAAEKKEYGGMIDMYGMGGSTPGEYSHVISADNFPNMGYAMGAQINYPEGLQKPIFAMGAEPQEKEMTLKEKYQSYLGAKPVAKYTNFPRHPKVGIDPRGNVTGTVDDQGNPVEINIEGSEANWKLGNGENFITVANNGGKLSTKRAEAFYNNHDNIALAALMNNTVLAKEAKEAANQVGVAKYGGTIKRMYAKGGMVPMYGGGGTPRYSDYFNFNDYSGYGPILGQTYGPSENVPMTNPIPGISSYLQRLQESMPMAPMRTLNSIGAAVDPLSIAEPQYQLMGAPEISDAYKNVNKPLRGEGTYPAFYSRLTGAGLTNPVSAGQTSGTPGTQKPFNVGNLEKALPYAPAIWNAIQAMRKPTQVPKDLGRMSTDLKAPRISADAAIRGIRENLALGYYNVKQRPGSNTLPGLTNLAVSGMKATADTYEDLRTKQAMMDYQAAAQRKAYEQYNAQADLQRYTLQSEADAVPTQYASAAAANLGQIGNIARQDRYTREFLNRAYPERTRTTVPGLSDVDVNSYTSGGNRTFRTPNYTGSPSMMDFYRTKRDFDRYRTTKGYKGSSSWQ